MLQNKEEIISAIKEKILAEAAALTRLAQDVDESFSEAVKLISECKARVVITGVGKSGHIGQKIAASMASLGIPAFFVHSCESLHGDMGMITRDDVVVMISNSGKTREVLDMLPSLKIIGAKTISMSNSKTSPLALGTDVSLLVKVDKEIDHLNLAPTASTTAVLAVGDALATVCSEMKGFRRQDFALSHPAGALGQQLLAEYQKMTSK